MKSGGSWSGRIFEVGLKIVKLPVDAIFVLKQFVMRAGFCYDAVLHDEDPVRSADRG